MCVIKLIKDDLLSISNNDFSRENAGATHLYPEPDIFPTALVSTESSSGSADTITVSTMSSLQLIMGLCLTLPVSLPTDMGWSRLLFPTIGRARSLGRVSTSVFLAPVYREEGLTSRGHRATRVTRALPGDGRKGPSCGVTQINIDLEPRSKLY